MLARCHPGLLAIFLLGLAAAAWLRTRLASERVVLELVPEVAAEAEARAQAGALERQVVMLSAGSGVLRALAIDFLWLRAIHQGTQGEHFDAGALSGLITALQPRLPEVWRFQAQNLAYNLTPAFAPEDRFSWVLRGVELLRDRALLHNPRSASLYLDLGFLFQQKIGLDLDAAGPLYRSELAATFEVDRQGTAGVELWRAWKLDPVRVEKLEHDLGLPLDFRCAASHAMYWAERGLGIESPRGPALRRRLLDLRTVALYQLLESGRPVRALDGPRYAFLGEPKFERLTEAALEEGLEGYSPEDIREARAAFHASSALAQLVSLSEEAARARFARSRDPQAVAAPTLEALVKRWATRDGEISPQKALENALDAAAILAACREPALAEGMRRAARLLALDASRGADARPFTAELEAAQARASAQAPLDALPHGIEHLAPQSRRPSTHSRY